MVAFPKLDNSNPDTKMSSGNFTQTFKLKNNMKQLIDPKEIESNYTKSYWSDAGYLIVIAIALSFFIMHLVAFVNANAVV